MDSFNDFSNLQFFNSSFQDLGECSKSSNYDWYHCHFHVPLLFQLSLFLLLSFILCKFFTPILTGDFSLKSKWQQDSSKYSSSFKQCCDLDGLDSSCNLQFTQSLFQDMGTVPRVTTEIAITIFFMFHNFSRSLARSRYLPIFFFSLICTL